MKNQKGFIQIPLLIAIIAGVLIVGGGGYLSVKGYQNAKIEKERILQEKEEEIRALAETQTKAFQEAQEEIEKLRQESEQAKKRQIALEQKVIDTAKAITKDLTISSAEIAPFLSGVVNISCSEDEGSGSLWNIPGTGYVVLTNKHVIGSSLKGVDYCFVKIEGVGLYSLNASQPLEGMVNATLDATAHFINFLGAKDQYGQEVPMPPVKDLNYRISSLRKCPIQMSLGSPVVLIGFPAFSETTFFVSGVGTGQQTHQTVTNGIISAHNTSETKPLGPLSYVNYFVSAKIDSGNSGGIALSKDNNGLCVLGIPTWLSIGRYETQGIVQNIHNVLR